MAQYDGPKILMWDVETSKMRHEQKTYQLKQHSNYLNPDGITRPVTIVCVAWKWLGSNYVASTSVLNDPERFQNCYYDDYHVVKTIHDLISSADILVAHNGDNFDWKMVRARMIAHGFNPPPRPNLVDTLKICRREFKLESNALRYVSKYLGVSQKDESPNWDLIAEGDEEEIYYCEKYCRGDIKSLEGVYLKIRPWDKTHPNPAIYMDLKHMVCACGSDNLKRNGHRYTKAGKYQRLQCNDCGAWSVDNKNLKAR